MKSEIARLKFQIDKSIGLLNNPNYMAKASFDKIELERKKLCDFKNKLNSTINKVEFELSMYLDEPFITYFIEEIRFDKYNGELFSHDYFNQINGKNIKIEEKEELLNLILNNNLNEIFLRNYIRYT